MKSPIWTVFQVFPRFHAGGWLVAVCLLGVGAKAGDYAGAAAILRQAAERSSKPAGANAGQDEASKLRAELEEFGRSAGNLPPAGAARRWLEFAERATTLQNPGRNNSAASRLRISAEELFSALPPPAVWGELARAVAARPAVKGEPESFEIGLRFLAATLNGDADARKRAMAEIQAKAGKEDVSSGHFYHNLLEQLSEALLAASDDPGDILKSLERQLSSVGDRSTENLWVPNLVSQVGVEKAESFLRKALTHPNVALQFDGNNETFRLAQKLGLELAGQMPRPQWALVNSLDAIPLYEAFEARFPAATPKDPVLPGLPEPASAVKDSDGFDRTAAKSYYLLGLIAHGRLKEAVTGASRFGRQDIFFLPAAGIEGLEMAGHTAALDELLYQILSQDPSLPLWGDYGAIAAHAGATGRMLTLAGSAATREDLKSDQKFKIRQVLCQALLSADRVEEGVIELRRLIAMEAPAPEPLETSWNAGRSGIRLAHLGVLLGRSEWTLEGIEVAKKWLAQVPESSDPDLDIEYVLNSLMDILLPLGRGAEMESLLADALVRSKPPTRDQPALGRIKTNLRARILSTMAGLYHLAGRPADVLILLEQSPDWGGRDLSELFNYSAGGGGDPRRPRHRGPSGLPLWYVVADALTAVGRKEAASKIIDELLYRQPGLDRAYELLLVLRGTNAMSRLDELFALDQFEERPLIWKAHLLKQQHRLEEAEAALRKAIQIDPSDEEAGRGDRMRAYSELADLRELRGDLKEAGFYRELVGAIRLSEDADRFYEAGLVKRAVAMYENALKQFPDAYCIQARLAVQLSNLGHGPEAEEHYRRTFELMPDSFGRMVSHCPGCEKILGGARARRVAESVFTKLVAEDPAKPQVHYLLGGLRYEQGRLEEARTNYLKAVQLDPDYFSAWLWLGSVHGQGMLPAKDRDQRVLNLLRLDPLHRHHLPSLEVVSNLSGLWQAVDSAARRQPPRTQELFPLAASEAALAKLGKEPAGRRVTSIFDWTWDGREPLAAGRILLQSPFVRIARELIFHRATD